ncbi:MAG: 2-amino-4-hydroxy-6-hydroxymethyldihydropteridine diphosphokinase [Ignavibacteria bacterium]|nr:2-amino-4-hydroxy-6-hydroxymethyldihydropteridine diphosphokinase [Ignavibacteria bacterium]
MADKIFLGLGSNKGDRLYFLKKTVAELQSFNVNIVNYSSVYETIPYGNKEQKNFYNAVVEVSSSLTIDNLFNLIKRLEKQLGRKESKEKWAPREIDIDILFYNQLIYKSDKLNIPHPGILERDFVMIPLLEIDKNFFHPIEKKELFQFDLKSIEKHIIQKLEYSLS